MEVCAHVHTRLLTGASQPHFGINPWVVRRHKSNDIAYPASPGTPECPRPRTKPALPDREAARISLQAWCSRFPQSRDAARQWS